jgi:hypothetical protein
MEIKHPLDESFTLQLMDKSLISLVKEIPYFKNFHEVNESDIYYFPITMDSNVENIKQFFQIFKSYHISPPSSTADSTPFPSSTADSSSTPFTVSSSLTIDSFGVSDLKISDLCELLKISFSLGCDEMIELFARRIAAVFVSLDMEELFGIPITKEFFDQSKNKEWKESMQEKFLSRSKPGDFIFCLHHLPFYLKKVIKSYI